MSDQKLHSIEETLAHHEQQIQDLSEMAFRQGRDIETLKKYMVQLQDKIGALENTSAPGDKGLSATEQAARDKPPHY